jgi:hypothetical protein
MKLSDTVCVFTSLIGSIHDHLLSGMLLLCISVPVWSPNTVKSCDHKKNSGLQMRPTLESQVTSNKNLFTRTKYQQCTNLILQYSLSDFRFLEIHSQKFTRLESWTILLWESHSSQQNNWSPNCDKSSRASISMTTHSLHGLYFYLLLNWIICSYEVIYFHVTRCPRING